jgi:hypothetical protein
MVEIQGFSNKAPGKTRRGPDKIMHNIHVTMFIFIFDKSDVDD